MKTLICAGLLLLSGCAQKHAATEVVATKTGYVLSDSNKEIPFWDAGWLSHDLTMRLDYPIPHVVLRGTENLSVDQFLSLMDALQRVYVYGLTVQFPSRGTPRTIELSLPVSDAYVWDVCVTVQPASAVVSAAWEVEVKNADRHKAPTRTLVFLLENLDETVKCAVQTAVSPHQARTPNLAVYCEKTTRMPDLLDAFGACKWSGIGSLRLGTIPVLRQDVDGEDGGMEPGDTRELKQLYEENRRLKRIVAEQGRDIEVLKDFASEKR